MKERREKLNQIAEDFALDTIYILRRAGDLVPLERERIDLIMGRDK